MSNGLVCKPLLIKELREILRWSPIGIILIGLLCWQSIPTTLGLYSSVATQFVSFVGVGAALVALSIGLLQSLGDSRTDARGFLLHRPLHLRSIFTTKLIAGFLAYVVCLAPPLIVTAIRLDVIGPERLPVSPLDLLPLLLASIVIFLLHPAAMWTSYRTARWLGTKTLPLVFAACGILLANMLMLQASGWELLAFFPLVVIVGYLVTVQAAWHAFSRETFLPPLASGENVSAARAFGLFVACVVLFTTVGVYLSESLLPRSQQEFFNYDLAIDSDGDLWEIQNVYRQGILVTDEEAEKLGRRVSIGQSNASEFEPLPDDWERAELASFNNYAPRRWYNHFTSIGQTIGDDATPSYFNLVAHDGKIFAYVSQIGVAHIITPDGVFDPGDQPTGRFRGVKMLSNASNFADVRLQLERNPLLIADNGVYQLDLESRKIVRLIDAEVESAAIGLPETKGGAASLWTITSNRLAQYQLTSSVSAEPLESASDPIISKTQRYPLPLLEANMVREFAINTIEAPSFATVAVIDDSRIVLKTPINAARHSVQVLSIDPDQTKSGIVRTGVGSHAYSMDPATLLLPPALVGLGSAVLHYDRDDFVQEETVDASLVPGELIVAASTHALLAAALAFWISGLRGVARKTQVWWAVLGAIFGVFALPAIIAIHGKPVYEPCPQCERQRRIDTNRCGHCGAEWERLPREGNEVIGGWLAEKPTAVERAV